MEDKIDLKSLKDKLEELTYNYEKNVKELEERNEKITKFEEISKNILSTKKDDLIMLNIGGAKFQTKISTLLSKQNSVFHQLIISNQKIENIFIDRSPDLFKYILQFLRTGKLQETRLKKNIFMMRL